MDFGIGSIEYTDLFTEFKSAILFGSDLKGNKCFIDSCNSLNLVLDEQPVRYTPVNDFESLLSFGDTTEASFEDATDAMSQILFELENASNPDSSYSLSGQRQNTKKRKLSSSKRRVQCVRSHSRYCHLCGRSSGHITLKVCDNFSQGTCRKAVCTDCIDNKLDSAQIQSKLPNWTCPHCQNMCPERARCHSYNASNKRRYNNRATQPPIHKNAQ
uniref:Zinc-finger domain-containing protein n=1 Tax=Timspurckia oligopyrenoides TaxID=708627 RepID=A0A7S0ZHB6_9RHOD